MSVDLKLEDGYSRRSKSGIGGPNWTRVSTGCGGWKLSSLRRTLSASLYRLPFFPDEHGSAPLLRLIDCLTTSPLPLPASIEYEFRGRSGSGSYVSGGGDGGGSSLYPRVGQPSHGAGTAPQRAAPYHHVTTSPSSPASPAPAPSSSPSSTSMGIQVVIKPEYRITPPPQLAPQMVEVPRSTFNFDFWYERKILAEAEKENPNWGKFVAERQTPPPQQQPQPPRGPRHTTSTTMAAPVDPVVEKYISMGLGREAVSFAVLNYGDNPTKVKEFVKSYNALHEMGFTSGNVPELLAIHDNDPDKVIPHLV